MKTNKTLLILMTFLLFGVTALAQESPSKQINQIKRNNSYLYAEATMETADEALSLARELLIQQVQEYISEKHKLSQAKDVLVKNINAKSESLSMMRGTMYRIFVYVKKNDIEAIDNVTAINTETNTTQVVVEQPLPPTPAPKEPTQVSEIKNSTTQGEPVTETGLPTWQQQAIEEFLQCTDMSAVKAKLNRMKAEYKIKKYGTASNCPNANEAYWILFNADGSVNTVLGTGISDRINFRNMTYTVLDNYKGMDALWFNFAK